MRWFLPIQTLDRGKALRPFPCTPFPFRAQKRNTMARPLKDPSTEPFDQSYLVRLTKSQKLTQLPELAKSHNMDEADFVRFRVFGAKPRRKKATPERIALITALGQLGNIREDINRLVKDRYKYVDPDRYKRALTDLEILAHLIHDQLEQ